MVLVEVIAVVVLWTLEAGKHFLDSVVAVVFVFLAI